MLDKVTTLMCESLDQQEFYIDKLNVYDRYSAMDKRNVVYRTQGLKVGENLPPITNRLSSLQKYNTTYFIRRILMEKSDIYKIIMSEFRCSNCNKQIFKGKLRSDYHIEAFCPRCKTITVFERSSIAKKTKVC